MAIAGRADAPRGRYRAIAVKLALTVTVLCLDQWLLASTADGETAGPRWLTSLMRYPIGMGADDAAVGVCGGRAAFARFMDNVRTGSITLWDPIWRAEPTTASPGVSGDAPFSGEDPTTVTAFQLKLPVGSNAVVIALAPPGCDDATMRALVRRMREHMAHPRHRAIGILLAIESTEHHSHLATALGNPYFFENFAGLLPPPEMGTTCRKQLVDCARSLFGDVAEDKDLGERFRAVRAQSSALARGAAVDLLHAVPKRAAAFSVLVASEGDHGWARRELLGGTRFSADAIELVARPT